MRTSTTTTASPIGERLRMEMKKRGVTSAELARRADVKMSFLYDIMSGKSANPSTVKLARVADMLGVSLAYLVGNTSNPHPPAPTAGARGSAGGDYVSIPRITVGMAAGGNAVVSEEHSGESYHFRTEWIRGHLHAQPGELRMLYVRGDSMEPTLCHDDIVLVDTSKKHPTPPGIFIVFDGLGLMAKRLELVEGGARRVRVTSDNPQYAAYERDPGELTIVGRVVWFAREI